MSRKFITAIAIGALTITGFTAQPTWAGNSDRDKALLGLAAFVLLGAAIADNRNDKKKPVRTHNHNSQSGGHNHGHNNGRPHKGYNTHGLVTSEPVRPRPMPTRVKRLQLPAKCLMNVRDRRNGSIQLLSGHCLAHNYKWANSMPRACTVRVHNGPRALGRAYSPHCLKRNGYTFRRS